MPPFVARVRRALLIPSGPPSNPDKKHLFIVVKDDCAGGFDITVHTAQAQADFAARYGAFAEAEKILLDDVAFMRLYFTVTRNIVAPHVKGFVDNPRDFHMSRFLRLEKPLAAR